MVALAGALALSACASAGAKAPCTIAPRDSVYVGREPVYEECAVDKKVKLMTTDLAPEYRPTGVPSASRGCLNADVQFVVDTLGHPEMATIRVLKTNEPAYAEAVLALVPRLKYDPAMIAGRPVRQIVTESRALGFQVQRVVVPAGSGPPPRSSAGASSRGPNC
jgi:hypothetical protein